MATREQAWTDKLRAFRTQQGAIPGPMEVWLAHRSVATLGLRIQRQCKTALEVARYLSGRPEVKTVRYPGLPGDPSHAVASRQMDYFGPIVGFVLEGQQEADAFLRACKVVVTATSFGGIHSMAERRGRWGGDAIPAGFIRFSAGCEDTEDVIDDVAQALGVI